jgi:hypothetical protein
MSLIHISSVNKSAVWKTKKKEVWKQRQRERFKEFEVVEQSKHPPRFWAEPRRHKQFFDSFASNMGIELQSEWYQFTLSDIRFHKGGKVLLHYDDHLFMALQGIYPQFNWFPWLFENLPDWFWDELENRQKYMEWMEEELNIQEKKDWYSVTQKWLQRLPYSEKFFEHYQHSLIQALQSLQSEESWKPGLFLREHRLWEQLEGQRKYFDWIASELGIETQEDFYNIQPEEVFKFGKWMGTWASSVIKAIECLYPEFTWYPWRFTVCPRNFWDSEENRKNCMEWLSEEFGIESLEDWYDLQAVDLIGDVGGRFLTYYGGSLINALQANYPDYEWLPWRFKTCPRKYWLQVRNQRKFFDWFADKMEVEKQSDWFSVKTEDVRLHKGGAMLLLYHGVSVFKALREVYPEYTWRPWLFKVSSKNIWSNTNNVKEYLDWLSQTLQLNTVQDWLQLSVDHLISKGGGTLLKNFGGINKVLEFKFPGLLFQGSLESE